MDRQSYLDLLEGLKAATPLVIGIALAYIARQQWKTSHNKLKLDLFDRRFAVYEATRSFVGGITSDMEVEAGALHSFKHATAQTPFLFPQPLVDYLAELENKARKLRQIDRSHERMMMAASTSMGQIQTQLERQAA